MCRVIFVQMQVRMGVCVCVCVYASVCAVLLVVITFQLSVSAEAHINAIYVYLHSALMTLYNIHCIAFFRVRLWPLFARHLPYNYHSEPAAARATWKTYAAASPTSISRRAGPRGDEKEMCTHSWRGECACQRDECN